MKVYSLKCTLVLLSLLFKFVISFEIFSISAAVAGTAAVGKFLFDNSICKFKECCSENAIPADFTGI